MEEKIFVYVIIATLSLSIYRSSRRIVPFGVSILLPPVFMFGAWVSTYSIMTGAKGVANFCAAFVFLAWFIGRQEALKGEKDAAFKELGERLEREKETKDLEELARQTREKGGYGSETEPQ